MKGYITIPEATTITFPARDLFSYDNIIAMRDYMQSVVNEGGNLNLVREEALLLALDNYAVEVLKHESTDC